jgi:plastocyanin
MLNVVNARLGLVGMGALAALAIAALVGCEASTDHSPPGNTTKIATATQPTTEAETAVQRQDISINGLGFSPSDVTVARGTTVVWTSDVQNAVTIVSGVPQKPGAGPLSGELGAKGATYTYTFDIPGEYPYFNEIQPLQAGKIVVNP